ncbi:hypothetical protein SBA2_270020 [Acidobacteriia bacterium SbA2]|nr:hypothetical protein SBA2_270020 [Acidobacteriia bacterium SbA2]
MSLPRIGLVGAVREPPLLEGRVIPAKAGIHFTDNGSPLSRGTTTIFIA